MTSPAQLADRIKVEILKDVRTGVVPATIGSFSQLHDYVDANCYGGTAEIPDDVSAYSQLLNPAMDIVDTWIKAGGVWEGIQSAKLGNRKMQVYRRRDDGEVVACLGNEKPPGDGWFVRASAEVRDGGDPHMTLHLMGRDMLIYSMYHAREPQYLGMAVEHFGAAAKKLGYSLPLKDTDASWLIYEHGDMDAGAPADSQFMLGQIAAVFGKKAAEDQAAALNITWPGRLGNGGKDRSR